MKFLPLCFLSTAYILATSGMAFAQGCCTVGASSVGGLQSGVLKYRTLNVGVNYQFNSLTRAYEERHRIEHPQRAKAMVSYFNLQAEYGLEPRLSVFISLVFTDKTRETTVRSLRFDETFTLGASGIGDVVTVIKYQLVSPSILSPFALAVGGGASLPTGSFTKEQGTSRLAIDLQPGTGAAALLGWVFAMHGFPEFGIRFYATATYRYSGTNFHSYRIGDEYNLTIGGEYTLDDHFMGSLLLRSRFASADFADRRILSATGGTYHDLMPGFSYTDGPSQLRLFAQLPIYRNVRGRQLTLSYLLGVEYSYVFDFSNAGSPLIADP